MSQKNVLLFSNPVWSGANTVPTTIVRNITALSSEVGYSARLTNNLTTLTTTNAETLNGDIEGLLYVPDIKNSPACDVQQYEWIPRNVTRQENLPPTNYNLIAIAPWFSIDCTQAYLASARFDPIRAFVFYKPNNSSNKPQDASSPVWNLDDGGAWKKANQFPIFAAPGIDGQQIVQQLSLYSGSIEDTPNSDAIVDRYNPNPNDYVRVWTELTLESSSNMLALWVFFLIVIGALILIVIMVSLTMHYIHRRRRLSLRRRVQTGEVDLEAMGIKRLTVPEIYVKEFPLFTYNNEPELLSMPTTPLSTTDSMSPRSLRSPRRKRRRPDQRSVISDMVSTRSTRSHRSSVAGSIDTTATNFQPNCHICLVRYQHRVTVIRELPCGHIFHTECIDEFLTHNSSLCPTCKQCMLPRGYCPKITNGMVRRERALRRLRERIDVDASSLESGEPKYKAWGKRLFTSSSTSSNKPPDIPMTPVKPLKDERDSTGRPTSQPSDNAQAHYVPTHEEGALHAESDAEAGGQNGTADASDSEPSNADNPVPQTPPAVKKPRPRKTRPRRLQLLPTHPEDGEAQPRVKGRGSPSSFARERMRQIAANNAPFDDPDQIPNWRRAITKVFPGL